MSIQDRIKTQREAIGLSMREVATALGVSPSTVSRYENGCIDNMGIDKLESLAKVLRCSPGYLMGWESNPTPLSGSDLSYDEARFLLLFRSLSNDGQQKLIERAVELRDLGYIKEDGEKMA